MIQATKNYFTFLWRCARIAFVGDWRYYTWMGVLTIFCLLGLNAYAKQFAHGLVVTGNVNKAAARPIHGGAITGSHVGVAIAVANVVDATISANTFPLFHGTPAYHPNTPYFDAIKPSNVNGLDITHDDFSGAQSVVHGARGNADVTRCENTYELDGRTDGPCPVSVLAPA